MEPRKLLVRIARGEVANVRFEDACRLAEALGFELRRRSGSNHVFVHPDAGAMLNLQDLRGEAKPYQLRQLLRLIERYRLTLQDEA